MVILDRCLSQSVGRDTSTMISSAYPEFYQSPMRVEGMYSPYSPRPQCGDLTSCLPPFYHPAGPVAGPVVQDPAYPVHPGLTEPPEVMQPEAMQPEAMAGYGQQYPVEHFVQYTPQLPHSNTSLINQAGQTEDMYSSTGGGSMAVSEPLAHYQNLRAFDSNMNQLNMSEVPQLEHDRSASLSDPEPEPERAYRWVQSSVEFPEEFPPVIRQVSDSGEGSTSSNDQQRAFSFVLEDPTQPNKICEKRPRSRSELDKQKEDIRELKKHGGACLSCYKMKKKCGPSTPCPQCKANKRQCIRKHAPSQQRPSQTPELDMSGSSIQDSDDVNELLETMQTPPSSKMSGIYCDLDDDCDFGGDLEL